MPPLRPRSRRWRNAVAGGTWPPGCTGGGADNDSAVSADNTAGSADDTIDSTYVHNRSNIALVTACAIARAKIASEHARRLDYRRDAAYDFAAAHVSAAAHNSAVMAWPSPTFVAAAPSFVAAAPSFVAAAPSVAGVCADTCPLLTRSVPVAAEIEPPQKPHNLFELIPTKNTAVSRKYLWIVSAIAITALLGSLAMFILLFVLPVRDVGGNTGTPAVAAAAPNVTSAAWPLDAEFRSLLVSRTRSGVAAACRTGHAACVAHRVPRGVAGLLRADDAVFAGAEVMSLQAQQVNAQQLTTLLLHAEQITSAGVESGAGLFTRLVSLNLTADRVTVNSTITTPALAANTLTARVLVAEAATLGATLVTTLSGGAAVFGTADADLVRAGALVADGARVGALTATALTASHFAADDISVASVSADTATAGHLAVSGAANIASLTAVALAADNAAMGAANVTSLAAAALTADYAVFINVTASAAVLVNSTIASLIVTDSVRLPASFSGAIADLVSSAVNASMANATAAAPGSAAEGAITAATNVTAGSVNVTNNLYVSPRLYIREAVAPPVVLVSGYGYFFVQLLGGNPRPSYKSSAGVEYLLNFSQVSDRRFKRDLAPIASPLQRLSRVGGYTFRWNADAWRVGQEEGREEIGLVAQEVEAAFPGVVSGVTSEAAGAYKVVDYAKLVAALVAAVNELRARVEVLEKNGCIAT